MWLDISLWKPQLYQSSRNGYLVVSVNAVEFEFYFQLHMVSEIKKTASILPNSTFHNILLIFKSFVLFQQQFSVRCFSYQMYLWQHLISQTLRSFPFLLFKFEPQNCIRSEYFHSFLGQYNQDFSAKMLVIMVQPTKFVRAITVSQRKSINVYSYIIQTTLILSPF